MYLVLSTKTLYMQIPPLFGESYIGIKYQTKKNMIFTSILESSLFAKLNKEGDRIRNSWNLKILKILFQEVGK